MKRIGDISKQIELPRFRGIHQCLKSILTFTFGFLIFLVSVTPFPLTFISTTVTKPGGHEFHVLPRPLHCMHWTREKRFVPSGLLSNGNKSIYCWSNDWTHSRARKLWISHHHRGQPRTEHEFRSQKDQRACTRPDWVTWGNERVQTEEILVSPTPEDIDLVIQTLYVRTRKFFASFDNQATG